jgi:hypothetical protein
MSQALPVDETDIQSAILKAFQARGIVHWRTVLGGRRVKGGKAPNPMKGFPDVAGVIGQTGKLFVCEVKKPGGRLSDEQVTWGKRLTDAGVKYMVAYSVDDALTGYDAFLLEKEFPGL